MTKAVLRYIYFYPATAGGGGCGLELSCPVLPGISGSSFETCGTFMLPAGVTILP